MRCNSKIHVIKDESLGGIEREYVEVDRKAEVGDKAIQTSDWEYKQGDIGVIDIVESDDSGVVLDGRPLFHSEYKTLEPTDIVHIDGERYRMVDRKAEVGEKIIGVEEEPSDGAYSNGDILIVDESIEESAWEYEGVRVVNPRHSFLFTKEYRVLVPVESELTAAEPPESLHDIIANLVRRTAQLESELTGAKRDVETWAQEVEALKHETTHRTITEMEPKQITLDVDTFMKIIGGAR